MTTVTHRTHGIHATHSPSSSTDHDPLLLTTAASTEGFAALGLSPRLTAALARAGVMTPFPIQSATLPDALAGRDVLGRGRTGSGKTYAFALPMLDRLAAEGTKRRPQRPRALVLAPTRELASQINTAMTPLAKALGLKTLSIFGGVGYGPQIKALGAGVDIVIACPGRLDDLVKSGHANLDSVSITVLDEADHMADLGFLPVVRRLLDQTPRSGQRLLFSATLDRAVDVLVKRYLRQPVTHSVHTASSPVTTMTHHVLHVDSSSRLPVLLDLVTAPGRTLIFTRTKHGAKLLARKLTAAGAPAVELHGNLSQAARTRSLAAFMNGSAPTLVATDIAARGIHVDDVALVVHADPPVEHKAYLHRSGRTARAGNAGTVVTLATDQQLRDLRQLARKAGIKPTVTRLGAGHPLLSQIAPGTRERITAPPLPEPSSRHPRSRRPAAGGSGSGRRTGGRRSGRPAAKKQHSRTGQNGVPSASTGGAAGFSAGSSRRRSR